jgi:integrase
MHDSKQKSPLLNLVRNHIRLKHYSIRTEEAYVQVIRRFILFHGKRHPSELGAAEIRQYLSHLVNAGQVSASTQNQALSALLFLYREVLCIELPFIDGIERAKRPVRVPTVLTREEVASVLAGLSGSNRLMASLLYGSGLRLMECVRLRVKDVDFDYCQIIVRDGKGEKDRRTVLPNPLIEQLKSHLTRIKQLHSEDRGKVTVESICLTRWSVNIRMHQPSGVGSGSSRQASCRSIHDQAWCAATTRPRSYCRKL